MVITEGNVAKEDKNDKSDKVVLTNPDLKEKSPDGGKVEQHVKFNESFEGVEGDDEEGGTGTKRVYTLPSSK